MRSIQTLLRLFGKRVKSSLESRFDYDLQNRSGCYRTSVSGDLRRMTALHKTVERIAARVLGILRVITVPRVWAKEVAMAKVIEFYIPKNFRKSFKWVPELQRGKILEFCLQTKKSA